MNLRVPIGCVCSALALYVGVQTVCAAPAPQVSWASKAGGTGEDEGDGISALPDGSSIVTGSFEGTAAFGNTILSSDGESAVFTAKMNADGTWAWATRTGGVEEAWGSGVSALPDGSSIVTGYFIGSTAFGSTTLNSVGDICGPTDDPDPCGDAFTAKVNADGTWAWATQTGGSKDAWGNGVSVLPDGSSIVTGAFQGTTTFGTTTLTSTGTWDVFSGANFTGANLASANLTNANLIGATLISANFTNANLTNADLSFVYLNVANLTSANLTSASLSRAYLNNTNTANTQWFNTICPNGTVTNTGC